MRNWRITWNSPVVLTFSLCCLLATIFYYVFGEGATQFFFSNYHSSLLSPMTYVRFITHVFGHAGWQHLFGNLSFILLLGPLLEEKYGSQRMIWVIVLTALSTGIVNFVVFTECALMGASGVVFAFILLSSFTRIEEGEIPVTFILVALIYLGEQIISGITEIDNVSNSAHIIGGIVGAAVGFQSRGGRRH